MHDRRHHRHDEIEVVAEPGHQRGEIAAEAEAEQADRQAGLLAQPAAHDVDLVDRAAHRLVERRGVGCGEALAREARGRLACARRGTAA